MYPTAIEQQVAYEFKPRAIIIWSIFILLGVTFRILHWPGSAIIILFSSAGFSAYSVSGLTSCIGRDVLNLIVSIISLGWVAVMLWGILYNEGYPYNIKALTLFGIVFGVYLLIYEVLKNVNRKRRLKKLKYSSTSQRIGRK